MSWRDSYQQWPEYVPVAERKKRAEEEIAKRRKKGESLSPVVIEGRTIATTFWGKAWCENLESYSDYENRIPRGRAYVRNRAVLDLKITPGKVNALVQGTRLYKVEIGVTPVAPKQWKALVAESAGTIDSMVELLRGKLSKGVMEVITRRETGLFPNPKEIKLSCSCPDWATMCKHVAAVLYGIGARLDSEPELLFRLRGADAAELVTSAAKGGLKGAGTLAKSKVLGGDLASMFGIELDPGLDATPAPAPVAVVRRASPARSRRSRAATVAAPQPVKINARDLRMMGVPTSTIHSWVTKGVLGRTETAGVYTETPVARERMDRYRRAQIG